MLTLKLPSRYTESCCSLLLHFCNLIIMEISFSPSSLLTTIAQLSSVSVLKFEFSDWSSHFRQISSFTCCPSFASLHWLPMYTFNSLCHFFLPTFTLVCTIHVSPTGSLIPSWLVIGIRDNEWRKLLTSREFYLLTSRCTRGMIFPNFLYLLCLPLSHTFLSDQVILPRFSSVLMQTEFIISAHLLRTDRKWSKVRETKIREL